MAIPINRVYETVLNIINKEKRGYLTPSEFNTIANLSQIDIFNDIMYDKSHFNVSPKEMVNLTEKIQEKIDVFKRMGTVTQSLTEGSDLEDDIPNTFDLPADLYQLETVRYSSEGGTYVSEIISTDELDYVMNSDKIFVHPSNPKHIRLGDRIVLYTRESRIRASNISIYYIKAPNTPLWNSIAIGSASTPLFNSASSVDFELHVSQEDELIKRILYYTGISIQQETVSQLLDADEKKDIAIKKE